MSTRVQFVRPLSLLAGVLLAVSSFAYAIDANVVLDVTIFDVRAPIDGPEKAGVRLAFNGDEIEVHLVAEGTGSLPDVNLGFSGETPRIKPLDKVHVSAVMERSTKVEVVTGGVVLEHRNVTLAALRAAYAQAFAELGFTLDRNSTGTSWRFLLDDAAIRVRAAPGGKNVVAYVGR